MTSAENQIHTLQPTTLAPNLAHLLAAGLLGHAYIFAGEQAMGQALAIARALNCQNLQTGSPCGICASCRKVTEFCHADCHVINPQNGAHRIEAMRKMQAAAFLKSYEGGQKIFIIEGAELLLEEAANSLLKLLEEPPADTFFVLVCANPDRLLPTIKSRCQLFLFGNENSLLLDLERVESYLPEAQALIQKMPRMALWQALQEARHLDLDKEGWLHYLCALWRVISAVAKGQADLPLQPANALKAALLLENTLDLLRRNINQKLLLDIVFVRLWNYVERD